MKLSHHTITHLQFDEPIRPAGCEFPNFPGGDDFHYSVDWISRVLSRYR